MFFRSTALYGENAMKAYLFACLILCISLFSISCCDTPDRMPPAAPITHDIFSVELQKEIESRAEDLKKALRDAIVLRETAVTDEELVRRLEKVVDHVLSHLR